MSLVIRCFVVTALSIFFAASGCRRPQPCEGNTCNDHGTCEVVKVTERGPERGAFSRYPRLRRHEICDCDGEDGFLYQPIGCGPAAAFSTCLPEPCETFVQRCELDQICVPGKIHESPICRSCDEDLVPSLDRLFCVDSRCVETPPQCPSGEGCGSNGECEACPENTRSIDGQCRPCPDGFAVVGDSCEPLFGRGYLMSKMQVNAPDGDRIRGALNGSEAFRSLWGSATDDGFNMIWDQDMVLLFFFPEFPDGQPPPTATEATVFVYEARFGWTDLWQAERGSPEPKTLRNSQRSVGQANYLATGNSGEACVRSEAAGCNPGYFNGEGLLVEAHQSTETCSPTVARMRVHYDRDGIRTSRSDWLLLSYAKYGFIFQAQQVNLQLSRDRTGLCADETATDWPCTGYVGHVRAVVRSVELFDAVREYTGGGLSEDIVANMLGAPDVDLDGDGQGDGHSLQFDIDLTPMRYAAQH